MISITLKKARTSLLKLVSITSIILLFLVTIILLPTESVFAQENNETVIIELPNFKWKPIDGVPKGPEVTVLNGNPSEGASEMMIKLPAGYAFPRHYHSNREVLLLSKGDLTYIFDNGKKLDLKTNSYINVPRHTTHSLTCHQEACLIYAKFDQPFDMILNPLPSSDS